LIVGRDRRPGIWRRLAGRSSRGMTATAHRHSETGIGRARRHRELSERCLFHFVYCWFRSWRVEHRPLLGLSVREGIRRQRRVLRLTGRDQIIQIDECRILAEKTLRGLFRSTGGGTQRRRRQRIPQQVQLEGIVRVVVGAVRCRRFRRVPVPVRYHVELVQIRRRALAGRRPRVVPGLGMGRRCRRRRVSQPSPWIRLRHGMGRLPRVARRRRRIAGWGRGERVRLPW
jgi:hypothetical protein